MDIVGPGRTHHLLRSSYLPKGPGEYYITIDDISYPFKTWHDENTENVATL